MVTKAEELEIGLAVLEAGFIDAITKHTDHKDPTILEPYDTFEIKGAELILFVENEFDEALAIIPEQKVVLMYSAPNQSCEGLVNVDAFRAAEGEKYLGIDSERQRVWGIVGATEVEILDIDDRGFWGFFEGDNGEKYLFSKGSETFVHYQLQIG